MPKIIENEIMSHKKQDALEVFRLLADSIPTICWIADAEGNIYWFNKRWYDYTGLQPGETSSREWQVAHAPDDHANVLEKWRQATKTKEPFDMVVSLKGADGMYRPFFSHILPVKDNEQVTGWIGIKNDISELHDANKALQESEERFKTLAEAMPQMAFVANASGEITYFNKRWYDYVDGMEGTEGWGWKEKPIHHPDDLEKTVKRWKESLKSGKDYEIEYRLRRYDGQYRWHLGRAVAVRDEKDTITSWIGTNTDIHEQRRQSQHQDFLLEASQLLAKTLDYKKTLETIAKLCVPQVADWCSVDLLKNDIVEQVAVAHVDPKKVALAKEFRVRNPVDLNDETSGLAKVLKTGKTEFYPVIDDRLLEISIQDAETLRFMKSLQLHSIIIVPIKVKDEVIGAITFVASDSGGYYTEDDVTMAEELSRRVSLAMTNAMLYREVQSELRRSLRLEKALTQEKAMLESRVKTRTKQLQSTNKGLEAEVERRRETELELQRSNQELQDFAYVASHDLQEPLRKIQAFGDILQNEFGEQLGDGAEYLKRMHGAATRMSQLIEDLLVFSRVTTKPPVPTKVDLNDIVNDVLSDLENRIKQTEGRVDIGKLPLIMADPTHMRQLFQNLIANALKFSREGVPPVVKISCKKSKSKPFVHTIIIKDNGIGFDKKYAERIFGVFQRLHGRGSYEGTGIGLAVCRKIVERYGGTIAAEGEPGKGATFTIQFPTSPEEKQ